MKKILTIVLSLLMVCFSFTFVACGESNDNANSNPSTNSSTNTPSTPTIVECSSISLSKSSLNLTVGDEESISATIAPTNTTNKKVLWLSSNSAVADYANGKIIALGEGNCIIKATCGNVSANCMVTVSKKQITATQISFEEIEYSAFAGQSGYLELTFSPYELDDYSGTVTSSNPSIVAVEYYGKYNYINGTKVIRIYATALKEGTATITVTMSGGATCSTTFVVSANMEDKVNVILPNFPCTSIYWSPTNAIRSRTSITQIDVVKEQTNAGSVTVTLTVHCKKTYDYNGNYSDTSSWFVIALYKENNVLCETEDYYERCIVGETWTDTYSFAVDVSEGIERTFTVKILDKE